MSRIFLTKNSQFLTKCPFQHGLLLVLPPPSGMKGRDNPKKTRSGEKGKNMGLKMAKRWAWKGNAMLSECMVISQEEARWRHLASKVLETQDGTARPCCFHDESGRGERRRVRPKAGGFWSVMDVVRY